MAARPRAHPVATCPRCGHTRRVEREEEGADYRFAEHRKAVLGRSWRCKGSKKRVKASAVRW